MTVANCTTPANLHHLLRRQVIRSLRAPLILMSPKSLLRHPEAVSTLDELAGGSFQPVIGEDQALEDVSRIVLCSGKLYYELCAARREGGLDPVALVRLEQLYPFPREAVLQAIAAWPDAELVWCQEEPRNMGAWPSLLHTWLEAFPDRSIRYIGRPASASPATGSHKQHVSEQLALVGRALGRGE